MLRYNSGVTLIKTSTSAMQKGLRAGLGGRFLKWLSNWFKEFKKILRAILKLIFKLLGKDLPTWVDDLLQFLDEIKDAVLDLIHVLLGGDSESFSKSLHHAEVAFYEQLAAVEKLQQSYSRKTHDNKD